jgi:hypothetical protein
VDPKRAEAIAALNALLFRNEVGFFFSFIYIYIYNLRR